MRLWNRVASLLVVMCLLVSSVPAFAYSPVLPNGPMLSDRQLEEVEGEGPVAAAVAGAVGFIVGGIGGAVSYAADYAWDKYVTKSDPTFDGNELAKRVAVGSVTGGTTGYIGGLLAPAP